ncbi:MAG: LysR substrate-binding domain-containing protein [Rubrivivax sp.]
MQAVSQAFRCFDAVARRGSVRKAAETLHLTAAAVHQQIVNFEQQVGTALFDRLPKGMQLTAAGEIVLGAVRRMQRDFDQALAQVEGLGTLQRGHVSLGVPHASAESLLPAVLRDVIVRHPGIRFDVRTGNGETLLRWLAGGEVDLAFCLHRVPPPGVVQVRGWPQRLGAAVAPGHPLAEFAALVAPTARTSRTASATRTVHATPTTPASRAAHSSERPQRSSRAPAARATGVRLRLRDCLAHPLVLPPPDMELRLIADRGAARAPRAGARGADEPRWRWRARSHAGGTSSRCWCRRTCCPTSPPARSCGCRWPMPTRAPRSACTSARARTPRWPPGWWCRHSMRRSRPSRRRKRTEAKPGGASTPARHPRSTGSAPPGPTPAQRRPCTPPRCMPLSSSSSSPVTVFAPSTSQATASATSSAEQARPSGTPAS